MTLDFGSDGWEVVVHEGEYGGYWGEVPAMPGCVSCGDTEDECLKNVFEAARLCLETYCEMAMEKLCGAYNDGLAGVRKKVAGRTDAKKVSARNSRAARRKRLPERIPA